MIDLFIYRLFYMIAYALGPNTTVVVACAIPLSLGGLSICHSFYVVSEQSFGFFFLGMMGGLLGTMLMGSLSEGLVRRVDYSKLKKR